MSRVLCRVDEIEEPGARGFDIPGEDGPRYIFVVRAEGRVHGYVNSCPHLGTPLDLMPDRFLSNENDALICATHGARFEISTGKCFAGPCQGDSLERLPVSAENGQIILKD